MPTVRSVAIGLWVRVGSRFEKEEYAGISHFIEHLLFKGTESRSAEDIARAIDSVGGTLDAFTSRENTCFYAKVLGEHLPPAAQPQPVALVLNRVDLGARRRRLARGWGGRVGGGPAGERTGGGAGSFGDVGGRAGDEEAYDFITVCRVAVFERGALLHPFTADEVSESGDARFC